MMELKDFEKELDELVKMSESEVQELINQFFKYRQKYAGNCVREIKEIYDSSFGNIDGFIQPSIWLGTYECSFTFALLFKKYGIDIMFRVSDDNVVATISKYYIYMSDDSPERKFLSNIINMFANDVAVNEKFVEIAKRIYYDKLRMQDMQRTHNLYWHQTRKK